MANRRDDVFRASKVLAEIFQSLMSGDAAGEGGAQQRGFEFRRHASTSKKSASEPTSSSTSASPDSFRRISWPRAWALWSS